VLQHRGFLTRPTYARRIRTISVFALALAVVAAASACGNSSSSNAESPGSGSTTTTTVTEPTTTAEGIDPLEGAGTTMVVGTTTAKAIALLERVAVGRHEGYDRVVFQFRGEGLPGYRVSYVEPPLKEDGSGNPVDIAGTAFVVVRMEPASGFDLNTGEGVLVYRGPRRIGVRAPGRPSSRKLSARATSRPCSPGRSASRRRSISVSRPPHRLRV